MRSVNFCFGWAIQGLPENRQAFLEGNRLQKSLFAHFLLLFLGSGFGAVCGSEYGAKGKWRKKTGSVGLHVHDGV